MERWAYHEVAVRDKKILKLLNVMTRKRKFFVLLNGQQSGVRCMRNGVPQCSVIATTLFKLYNVDMP